MAAIITMNSKDYLRKFIPKYDYKKFQTIIISGNIRTKGKFKQAYALDSLMPSTITLSSLISQGDKKTYKRKYSSLLMSEKNDGLIAILMKLVVKEEIPVVLLCTPEEEEYGYIKMLKSYIEDIYEVDVMSFKKFDKDPSRDSIVNPKKTGKILKNKLAKVNTEMVMGKDGSKKLISDKLDQMKKADLKDYCRSKGIRVKNEDDAKKIRKRILKHIFG